MGAPGWLSWLSIPLQLSPGHELTVLSDLNDLIVRGFSGHDLIVREFEAHVGLCADSLGPGAWFGSCVSLPLSLPLAHLHSVSVSLKNKH